MKNAQGSGHLSGLARWVWNRDVVGVLKPVLLVLPAPLPGYLPCPAKERGASLAESLGDHRQPVTRVGLSWVTSAGFVIWGHGHNRV